MQSLGCFVHSGFGSLIGTSRRTIFAISLLGLISTFSFLPSFSCSSYFASSVYFSMTVSLSVTSSAGILSYWVSAPSFTRNIGVGMNEQYFLSTSLILYSLQNSRESSLRKSVMVVPTSSRSPSSIVYSVPPSHSQ